jgi:hypothetical protein
MLVPAPSARFRRLGAQREVPSIVRISSTIGKCTASGPPLVQRARSPVVRS